MSPLWGNLIGVLIVILMLTFIGIWIWAWRPLHKKTFDSLAQIPMENPIMGSTLPTSEQTNRHGAAIGDEGVR